MFIIFYMSNKFFSNSYDSDSSESDEETKNTQKTEELEDSKKDNTKEIIDNMANLITLRYIKDGKASRTYIEGLKYFYNSDEVKKITKEIQKKLSTGYFSNGDSHGFNGEHKLKIEKMLYTQYNIPKNKIKVC